MNSSPNVSYARFVINLCNRTDLSKNYTCVDDVDLLKMLAGGRIFMYLE